MESETTFTGYADRDEAGRRLASALARYRGQQKAVVVGIACGGAITAAAVADELDLSLDLIVVRKLPVPGLPDVSMGAIAPDGIRILDPDVISHFHVLPQEMEALTRRERMEMQRQEALFRGDAAPVDLSNRIVILVDDGVASGITIAAAIEAIHAENPSKVVLAVPVAPLEVLERFRFAVDELFYLDTPEPFGSIDYWYAEFPQIEEGEVRAALERARSVSHALV